MENNLCPETHTNPIKMNILNVKACVAAVVIFVL
jgi:hypothetical protein